MPGVICAVIAGVSGPIFPPVFPNDSVQGWKKAGDTVDGHECSQVGSPISS